MNRLTVEQQVFPPALHMTEALNRGICGVLFVRSFVHSCSSFCDTEVWRYIGKRRPTQLIIDS